MNPNDVMMSFPFTDIEIEDLVPAIPPNISPSGRLRSSHDLVRRVNFTFDFHRHFAQNCRLDCQKWIVPKKRMHQINSEFIEVCPACHRRDSARGEILKYCSKVRLFSQAYTSVRDAFYQCKSTKYCSPEVRSCRYSENTHQYWLLSVNVNTGKSTSFNAKLSMEEAFFDYFRSPSQIR